MSELSAVSIRRAQFPSDREVFATLIREYVAGLPFVLAFQDHQAEIESLPGAYAEPAGCVLLAERRDGGAAAENRPLAVGCVALRPLEAGVCEMKRMYVRPEGRGAGIATRLTEQLLREARERGYRTMRLDTIARMTAANALYRGAGFVEIGPYCFNPLPDALYFERSL